MNNNQRLMWAWCITVIVLLFAMFSIASCDTAEEETQEPQLIFSEDRLSDKLVEAEYEPIFQRYEFYDYGYETLMDWYNDMQVKNAEAEGTADEAIEKYTRVISDEQKEELRKYESVMSSTLSCSEYEEAAAGFQAITDKCAADLAYLNRPVYSSSSYSSNSGDHLTRSGGVYYYNGRKETWYSQRVLPGGGLNIPGRHVASDGTIRDADGYICVAASDLAYGTVVETSLGTAKVYDTGCAAGTTDIYTNW